MSTFLALALSLISPEDLSGGWRYDGFIYRGERYPLPNPELHLTFTFRDANRVKLFWKRSNEEGFCERDAQYDLQNDYLHQKIDWVNPENSPECERDPDMQLGHESFTRIGIIGEELHLFLNLDEEEFVYVMKRERTLTHSSKENL